MEETKVLKLPTPDKITRFLAKDPEMRYTSSGLAIWSATAAISPSKKKREEFGQDAKSTWVNLVAFGRLAEALGSEGLKKGDLLALDGEFQTDLYRNSEGEVKPSLQFVVGQATRVVRPPKAGSDTPKAGPARGRVPDIDAGLEDDLPF